MKTKKNRQSAFGENATITKKKKSGTEERDRTPQGRTKKTFTERGKGGGGGGPWIKGRAFFGAKVLAKKS